MVQNTLVIDNQAANPARLDIQEAIRAVATNSSDATASPTASTPPTTTYPNMWWYDTFTHLLNIRNEANNAWLNVAYLNQGGTFEVLDDTKVVNTSGTQTGLLGDQTTGTWEAGTGTTESLVSPAKVKASVIANAPSFSLNLGTFTSASGNSFLDFSVPTTATEIHVNWYDVVNSGSVQVQLKVGGTPVTSGYYSASGTSGAESGLTTGFYMYCVSGRQMNGVMTITKASSSVWMSTHSGTQSFAENSGAGRLVGAGTVNGVRFSCASSFSAGEVSVSWR
jgi:hypothetical protein